jgi:DNA-binding response OmpR family regulator
MTPDKRMILVIDDDPQIRTLLQTSLTKKGYEIHLLDSGFGVAQVIAEHPVSLVITDIIMPDREGLETIRELKTLRPEIRIIAMSGGGILDKEGCLFMAGKMGADRILAKPFSLAELYEAMESLLG